MSLLKPRVLLAETVRQFLPLNDRLKLPRKAYGTSREWWESEGSHTGAKLTPLDPPKHIKRREPATNEPEPHWIFERDREDNNWETFVLEFEEGRILRDDAVVLTPDRAILGDVSREPNRKPQEHSLFRPWRLPPMERVRGTAAVLSVVGGKRYYHWLMDLLPRLGLLERAGYILGKIDKFVVNDFSEPFQKETLAHFGITEDRLIVPTYSTHLKADRLLLPSLPGTSGNPLKSTHAFLRKAFLPKTPSPQKRRLFLSRKDATYRRLLNEDEVTAYLEKRGYEPVTLSGLSIKAQAALFQSAESIVATHGGGLANLVFATPGARVVELFAPTYVNTCFYALADLADLNYAYLLGEGPRPKKGDDPHAIEANFTVNLNALEAVLSQQSPSGGARAERAASTA